MRKKYFKNFLSWTANFFGHTKDRGANFFFFSSTYLELILWQFSATYDFFHILVKESLSLLVYNSDLNWEWSRLLKIVCNCFKNCTKKRGHFSYLAIAVHTFTHDSVPAILRKLFSVYFPTEFKNHKPHSVIDKPTKENRAKIHTKI